MTDPVVIRPTVAADADALRGIRLAALHHDPGSFSTTHDEALALGPEVWLERATGSDTVRNIVAELDGRLVGLVAGIRERDHVELVSMWTAPDARGHGVGRRLVEAVLEWAGSLDVDDVRLWVVRGNDPAFRLYERCGFHLTGEEDTDPADPCRGELRMRWSAELG